MPEDLLANEPTDLLPDYQPTDLLAEEPTTEPTDLLAPKTEAEITTQDMPTEFTGEQKQYKVSDPSMIDKLTNEVVKGWEKTGKDLGYGWDQTSAQIANTLANIPMLLNKANDYLVEKTGEGKPSEKTVFGLAEKWLREQSQAIQPKPEEAPQDVMGKIYSGLGATPGTIAQLLPAMKVAGPVAGMGAVSALQEAEKGPQAAAEAGAKGALMGGVLGATAPLAMSSRVPTMAAVGGASTAAEGGELSDVVANSVTMGILGAMGKKDGIKLTELKPKAKTQSPVQRQAEEIKAAEKTKEFAGNINLDKIDTDVAVKQVLKDVANKYEEFSTARRGVVSHEETKLLASELGMTAKDLIKRNKGQAFNAHEAFAARTLLVDSGEKLVNMAKAAQGGSDADMLAFQKQLTRHVAIQEQVAGMTAEAGRALNQFKIEAKSSKAQLQAIQDLIEINGGRKKIKKVAEALADPKNAEKLNELSRKMLKPKPSDMAMEVWINWLLSGLQTHAVNMSSNTAVALWTIPENILAAGIGKLHGGEKVTFRDAMSRSYGFIEGAKQGARDAWTTLKTGEPTDPLSKIEATQYKAVPGKVGEGVRLPGRFLAAEDEFFKAIGYRMELNSLAYRKAINEGLKGRELAKRVEELKYSPTEEMHLKAEYNKRYQTFTKPLGDFGQSLQSATAKSPYLKLIVPFVRTPTNIIKFAGERSALGLFSKNVRDVIKKGGPEADQQLARMAMGSMVSTAVVALVREGMITGGGPSDPKMKGAMYQTGWMPYSIHIGDQYYSYGRLEPFGMLVGVTADAAEISEKIEKGDTDKIAALITASIAKNLTSKTFLKGISDTIKAIDDPERYGDKWIKSYAGSVIPSAVAQYARTEDPILRETNSMMDAIKSRIPGISKTLLPRRNLWGEPIELEGGVGPDIISPIYQSTKKNDAVSNEIVRLEVAPGMPKKKINGIQLTPEQYDEHVVESGTFAKSLLDKMVNTEQWPKMSDFVKRRIIEDNIRDSRRISEAKMTKKYPELLHEHINAKIKETQQ